MLTCAALLARLWECLNPPEYTTHIGHIHRTPATEASLDQIENPPLWQLSSSCQRVTGLGQKQKIRRWEVLLVSGSMLNELWDLAKQQRNLHSSVPFEHVWSIKFFCMTFLMEILLTFYVLCHMDQTIVIDNPTGAIILTWKAFSIHFSLASALPWLNRWDNDVTRELAPNEWHWPLPCILYPSGSYCCHILSLDHFSWHKVGFRHH